SAQLSAELETMMAGKPCEVLGDGENSIRTRTELLLRVTKREEARDVDERQPGGSVIAARVSKSEVLCIQAAAFGRLRINSIQRHPNDVDLVVAHDPGIRDGQVVQPCCHNVARRREIGCP